MLFSLTKEHEQDLVRVRSVRLQPYSKHKKTCVFTSMASTVRSSTMIFSENLCFSSASRATRRR
ncbi:hypothetical protein Hanom_Chr14g01332391 [Helianthus anomalus]